MAVLAGEWGTESLTDSEGNALPYAQFAVYIRNTVTLATLYTDETKAHTAPNPATADSLGNVVIYADPGKYTGVNVATGVEFKFKIDVDPSDDVGVTDHGDLTGLGDDDHTIYAKKASNLADLTNAGTARTNLGLGTAATHAHGDYEPAGTVATHLADTTDAHDASAISFAPTGSIAATDVQAAVEEVATEAASALAAEAALARNADNLTSGTVADARIASTIARDSEVTAAVTAHEAASDPHTGYLKESNTIDFLVGTATAELGGEIVVGTTPGGELGGTWASPTVDTTHSGTSHAGVISAHEAAGDPHTGYVLESALDESVRDAIGTALTDSATIDFTPNDGADTITADVKDASITLAKMANLATDRLIGRDTAGTGVPEALTVGGGVEFTGSGGIQTSAFTGDVTKSAGGTATTIPNDTVTYAKMQNVSATDRLLGRDTAAAGDVEELTVGGGVEFTGSGGIQRSALTGDVTATAGSNATTLANDAVTFAKMQNIATDSLIGRDTASSGDPENILLNATLEMDGSGNLRRAALTGDVTASAGSNTTAIANDAVTNAQAANMAQSTIKGRAESAGTGDPTDLTPAQAWAVIDDAALATANGWTAVQTFTKAGNQAVKVLSGALGAGNWVSIAIGRTSVEGELFIAGTVNEFFSTGVAAGDIGLRVPLSSTFHLGPSDGTGAAPLRLTSSLLTLSGVISAATGYRVNGAAAAGEYLRGDGTNFVSSPILGDLMALGM